MANNLLAAIKYLEERGRGGLDGGIFGYEGFQSRRLISEMLGMKRYWEALLRIFEHGIVGLDEDGRVLLANPAASRLFGKKELRLIGEPFPALLAARDRQSVQQALGELKKARLPEDRHVELTLGDRRVRLRMSNVVEDGTCAGILVLLESRVPSAKAHPRADSA